METIGYGARTVNASMTPDWTLIVYIIESLFILLGPALLAASIYMVLGRIVQLLDAGHLSWVPPRWLTKIFVTSDVVSFLAQLAGKSCFPRVHARFCWAVLLSLERTGGGILASADDKKGNDLGRNVILVGLAIQIIFFSFFFVVTIAFHRRIRQDPTPASTETRVPWITHIYVLYAVSALILVRSIFRVIEYAMGKDGVLVSNEVYIYIFDALLIFICVVTFNVWHPSRVVAFDHGSKVANVMEMEILTDQTSSKS